MNKLENYRQIIRQVLRPFLNILSYANTNIHNPVLGFHEPAFRQ